MEKIVLIGGGGHARVLIDLINACGSYEIAGIVDAQLNHGVSVSGVTVLGNDSVLPELYGKGIKNACIAVGSVKDNNKRKALYEKVKHAGFSIPALVHPSAIISAKSQIREGAQIMAGAIVQTGALICENSIVNTGAIVEHDCAVGNHAHICPGATLSGGCFVGEGAFIGAGATVLQGIKIGNNSIVSAGAVVIRDVPDNTTVIGVPAKQVDE
jgi:UDP-perosamine 4-acetyltransferase